MIKLYIYQQKTFNLKTFQKL